MVREIIQEDYEGLMKLYMQLHDNPFPEKDSKMEALWNRILEDKDHHIIVAVEDGKIAVRENCYKMMLLTGSKEESTLKFYELPYPYTQEDARQWISMTSEKDGIKGIYRAMLDSAKWSKGIMTYSVERMCKLAFEKLDIIRITAQVFEPNKASQKVLEKNGFALEGIMKNAVCKDDNIYDLRIYGKYK